MKIDPSKNGPKTVETFENRKSPWTSLCLSWLLLILNGIQFSIYMTSAWPYLKTLEQDTDLHVFGWVMAAYSVGQMISSWLFGYWNQKTMSTRNPALCGLVFAILGNVIYGILPMFSSNRSFYMLIARLLTGFGAGNLSIIRSYCAMASSRKDRTKAVSLATGSFVLGISFGPAIQAMLIPLGAEGIQVFSVTVNMYTAAAFLMALISLGGVFLLVFFFAENYVGIISEEEKQDPFMVIPKFDRIPAFTCIYLWFVMQEAATSTEILTTPLTISLYKWNNEEALFYNGLLQMVSCFVDVSNYVLLSFTRMRKAEKRNLLIAGIACFIVHQILMLPWAFYSGGLEYIALAPNATVENTVSSGGCYRRYDWCAYAPRVPLLVYVLSFTFVLGCGFPYLSAPTGIIFSEVLGPRKQGMMYGTFTFFGCLARCLTPLYTSLLFERYGYMWPHLINLMLLVIGLLLVTVFRARLVPLRMVPKLGVPTRYKAGTFYRL